MRREGCKESRIDQELARRHYAEHEGKAFFAGLVAYITSSPVIAVVFEGNNAVAAVRGVIGSTNPVEATPGSIRGDFGLDKGRNLVHASDSPESGRREVGLFFRPDEVLSWTRDSDRWVFE